MAKLAVQQAVPENVDGDYFVTEDCIDCDLCRQTAPQVFTRKHVGNMGYSYVYRQPRTEIEVRASRDALQACPVEAIGYKLF